MTKVLLLSVLLMFSGTARAQTMALELDQSSIQSDTDLTILGEFSSAGDESSPYGWNFDIAKQKSATPNDGGPTIIDNSTSGTAGLTFDGISDWNLGTKFSYSQTPEESLISRGAQLSGGYEWKYGPQVAEADSQPSFELAVQGAHNNYVESYSADLPRKKKAPLHVAGTSELRQGSLGLLITWKPVQEWHYNLEVDQYSYNRDVVSFENQLDSPAALKRGMGGFTNTVGGLASNGVTVGFDWTWTESWKLSVSEQISKLALDGSIGQTFKATFDHHFAKAWKLTAGYEREQSNTLSDTLAILGVQYERE